jgi:hypothetical protein
MSSSDHISNNQFIRGTLGQVGAKPGLGRKVFGTPSARQAAANRGINAGRVTPTDTLGVLDYAIEGTPVGKALGFGDSWRHNE